MSHLFHLIIKIRLCYAHPLVNIHMGHKYIHIFFLFSEGFLHTLPQVSLSPSFQSCFFQVPDHLAKPLAIVHEAVYNHTSGHSSSKQTDNQVHCLKFRPLGGVPFTTASKDVPGRGLSSTAVHFQGVWCLYISAEPLVNQAQIFFYSVTDCRQGWGGAGWGREDSPAGVKTKYLWSSFSCNLLVHNYKYTTSI